MKKLIKRVVPSPFIHNAKGLMSKVQVPLDYFLIRIQPYRYKRNLKRIKKKEQVKVAFFVLNIDIWKYEELYLLLEKDDRFEPVIIICPPTNLDDEAIYLEMNKAHEHFILKKYNVISSFDEKTNSYIDVKRKVSPDVVFFSNPYGYTLKRFCIKNFLDGLTCYSQYSFIMEESEHFYNRTFHNLLWKAFYETDIHKELAERFAMNGGANVEITGYPGTDNFVFGKRVENNAWKNKKNHLKRIIWAPHWSVIERGHGRLSASNFLQLSDFMFEIADKYKDKIQIAFKPHPYLKSTLYNQDGWGKEKTISYYCKWRDLENAQLEVGSYIDLFNSSDAMILDSISFIAEYLYCGKPSLYYKSDPEFDRKFNTFGKKALEHHYHGNQKEHIISFIEDVVLEGRDTMKEKRDRFYFNTLTPPNGNSASHNIYEKLYKEIFDSR